MLGPGLREFFAADGLGFGEPDLAKQPHAGTHRLGDVFARRFRSRPGSAQLRGFVSLASASRCLPSFRSKSPRRTSVAAINRASPPWVRPLQFEQVAAILFPLLQIGLDAPGLQAAREAN